MAIDKARLTVPSTIERLKARTVTIFLSNAVPPNAAIKIDPETGEVFSIQQTPRYAGQLAAVALGGGRNMAELWCVVGFAETGGGPGGESTSFLWKRVALTRAFDKGTGELWDPRANFYTSLATQSSLSELLGWSFFDRQRAAETFLSTGSAAAQAAAGFTPLNPFDDFITPNTSDYRYGKCWDNSNCAAGFYCVGGQCVQNNTAGNLGGTQNPGDCSEPVYDCGRNLGCAKPKCIETSVDDCCNDERCCRYASTGVNGPTTGLSVQCYCGPCPSPNKCNQWCDSYLKTIGKYLPSCNRDNTCTECADCIGGAGPSTCLLDTFNPPCHCDENQCGECESCDRETGNCYSDAKKCKFCKNFFPKCPGQEFIEEAITICKDNQSISEADIE